MIRDTIKHMEGLVRFFSAVLIVFQLVSSVFNASVYAQLQDADQQISPTPKPCGGSGCPVVDDEFGLDYVCAADYEQWRQNPEMNYWIEDSEVTFLGKNGERARQFVYWVLQRDNIYFHSGLKEAWSNARNVALALAVLIVAVAGLLIIVSERVYAPFNVEIRDVVLKTAGVILFILFSFTITVSILQVSDILMLFFVENMNVRSLFNIFFTQPVANVLEHSETAYKEFVGCRNLSTLAEESVRTSMFLVRITNITYFVIGVFLLIREIVIWFLVIVSPFLPLLLYFRFIRNTGFIWIGVFFQWVFYGPLVALFLGSVALVWQYGIPFIFNFSRINSPSGFIYPTGISILYGGPAQRLSFANTSNYIDTFAEYVISLLMLWTAVILPWWLLRIFRDYCCEGIYALKNVVMSFYEKYITKKPPSPPSPKTPPASRISTARPAAAPAKVESVIKIDNIQQIKQMNTQQILETLDLKISNLQDIARLETNRQQREKVENVIKVLRQPELVTAPADRQKVMTLKTELYERAKQQDRLAEKVIQITSRSIFQQEKIRKEIIKEKPVVVDVATSVSTTVKVPQKTVSQIFNSFSRSIVSHTQFINSIAKTVNVSEQKAEQVVNTITQYLNQPVTNLTNVVSKRLNIAKEKVREILKTVSHTAFFSKVVSDVSRETKVEREVVKSNVEQLKEMIAPAEASRQSSVSSTPLIEKLIEKKKLVKTILKINQEVLQNTEIISMISRQTHTKENFVRQTIQEFNQALETGDKEAIALSFADKDKREVLSYLYSRIVDSVAVVDKAAKDTHLEPEKIEQTVQEALPVIAEPEKEIEKTIAPPPTLSIEEYENTKKLWKDHYLKGEIPISENIATREEWLENDIIILTNTLNKLLSDDPKVREEGLEDVSYILPLFMLSDMKFEDILVYLKAKLEAAKEVKEELKKEELIKKQVREEMESEELVKVQRPAEREEKRDEHLHMQLEEEPEADQDVFDDSNKQEQTDESETLLETEEKEEEGVDQEELIEHPENKKIKEISERLEKQFSPKDKE